MFTMAVPIFRDACAAYRCTPQRNLSFFLPRPQKSSFRNENNVCPIRICRMDKRAVSCTRQVKSSGWYEGERLVPDTGSFVNGCEKPLADFGKFLLRGYLVAEDILHVEDVGNLVDLG